MAPPVKKLIEKVADVLGYTVEKKKVIIPTDARGEKRQRIHYLHIGKTAGTALKQLMVDVNKTQSKWVFLEYGHSVVLKDLPREDAYCFSVREPVSRFYSAFYNRKNQGYPGAFSAWSAEEVIAFNHFPEANDLAESLFEDGRRGEMAMWAMNSIGHVSTTQLGWFHGKTNLFERRPPLFVLRQSKLQSDAEHMLRLLGVKDQLELKRDTVGMHKNDYSKVPPLSQKAKENIAKWFAADCEFYKFVDLWVEDQIKNASYPC